MSPLPHPPQLNWALLFAMNDIPRGHGRGIDSAHYRRGMEIVVRHSVGIDLVAARGENALIEYLEENNGTA